MITKPILIRECRLSRCAVLTLCGLVLCICVRVLDILGLCVQVLSLLKPVCLTMLIVVYLVHSLDSTDMRISGGFQELMVYQVHEHALTRGLTECLACLAGKVGQEIMVLAISQPCVGLAPYLRQPGDTIYLQNQAAPAFGQHDILTPMLSCRRRTQTTLPPRWVASP